MSQNQELVEELHKPIIRKFQKQTLHSSFIESIWGAALADMQLIIKFNIWIRFWLCITDIFNKYAWVVSLKNKKGATITNAFQKILDEPNCKPKNLWVDKGSEFYNRSMQSWLEKKCYRNVFNT